MELHDRGSGVKNGFKYEMNATFFEMDFEDGFEGSLALFVVLGGVNIRLRCKDFSSGA